MKILLIYPPNTYMIKTNVPEFVVESTGLYPPLGLLYVASYIEKNSNHEIEILDSQVEKMTYDDIKVEIKRRKPDIVGIQTMTFTLIDCILTAKIVKDVSEDIHVCLGGPHVNIYPNETISIPYIDSLVLGEGEYVFTDLINAIANKKDLSQITGLVFKDNGKVINTGVRKLIDNLDELPHPARHMTSLKKYYSLLAKRSPVTTMMSSRGCPYKCLFCDRPHLGKRFRPRTASSVVSEMEECIEMGIKEIFFYDDTFAINKDRVHEICDEILKRGLSVGWDIRTRVDIMDGNILEKLKKAGCERIHYGVESGNPEILKLLRKGIQLNKVKEVFKLTKDIGIMTLAYFMIGSPTEDKSQIEQTIDFAIKLDPDFVHFSITTPFPATDLYLLGLDKGIIKRDYWREFAKNPTSAFVPQVWEEKLTREELIKLLKFAYKRFYIRPIYIIKELLKIRSLSEFKRKVGAGLRLIKS